MIKINNLSKSAFKKLDAILPDGWYCKETKIEEAETFNLSLSNELQITKIGDEFSILLTMGFRSAELNFNEFSEMRFI